jgi:hypothetical protein
MALVNVGDAPLVRYELRDPRDRTLVNATVAATLTDPAGTTTSLSFTSPSTGLYDAFPAITSAGQWKVTFTATGAVTDTEVIYLQAVAASDVDDSSAPPWSPSLASVASHVPTRTRQVGTDDDMVFTFNANTTPTADQASAIIGHACVWVTGCTGMPVVPAAYPLAELAASLWAAYWIEIAYPERDNDTDRLEQLRKDADVACARAGGFNVANGGGAVQPETDSIQQFVVHSFPAAPSYADTTFL